MSSTVEVLPLVPVTAAVTSGNGAKNFAASCANNWRGLSSASRTAPSTATPGRVTTATAPAAIAAGMKASPLTRVPWNAPNTVPGATELASALSLRPNEPLWVCGSTGPGEEQLVLTAYKELLKDFPALRLAIIPRHPERFDEVEELIRNDNTMNVIRRSAPPSADEAREMMNYCSPPVILGDTMGELLFLYALADVAFVGGSLVPNGGHNLLEPAALGKPVLSGPQLFNFLEIAAQLREVGALREVLDAPTLAVAVGQLWDEPAVAQRMAEAGLGVLKANQGALRRLLDGLARLLD